MSVEFLLNIFIAQESLPLEVSPKEVSFPFPLSLPPPSFLFFIAVAFTLPEEVSLQVEDTKGQIAFAFQVEDAEGQIAFTFQVTLSL